jgi:hypothetical protein
MRCLDFICTRTLQQNSAERAFNKLARTFAVQVEALKRYRTGGEQKVTVQHVTVNEGGQAIVGSVSPRAPRVGGVGMPKEARDNPVHRLPMRVDRRSSDQFRRDLEEDKAAGFGGY